MGKVSTNSLTFVALLIALVVVATMVITIPVPGTEGFIHLGDSMIFLVAVFFGKRKGAIAGGLGSALADLLLGYTHWVLPTLLIKGIMGYGIGLIAEQQSSKLFSPRNVAALVFGALWMVTGYFFAGAALKGSFLIALGSVPANLIQGFGGAALFVPLGAALKKTGVLVPRRS